MTKHKDKIIDVFKEYKNEQNKINLNDYLLVIRNVIAIDPNLQLFENRADVETFPEKVNCLKTILNSAKKYFFDYLGLSTTLYPTVTTIDIGYDVYWEFFDYLIKMSPNFYIEFNMGGEADNLFKLRREIEDTLEKYKKRLGGAQSDLELNIIQSRLEMTRHNKKIARTTE